MLCIGLPGNGSRCPGCGNEAGQKTIRGMVFPTNAPQGERLTFTSTILPPYLRRAKSIEELLPWLYLKGISTGDFSEALAALLGPDAPGLSASTITRLKAHRNVSTTLRHLGFEFRLGLPPCSSVG